MRRPGLFPRAKPGPWLMAASAAVLILWGCGSRDLQAGTVAIDNAPAKAAADVPLIVVPEPRPAQGTVADTADTPRAVAPYKAGDARAVPQAATVSQTSRLLVWKGTPRGGSVAMLRIRSTGAKGVRLGLLVQKIPAGTVFRFHGGSPRKMLEVAGDEISSTIQRNLDAGDRSDDAKTYWSPDLRGDEATIEIELAPGVQPHELMIAIPRLSHIVV
ncbi:MAG: putative Lysyl endopeptidase [Variovorax sp.]|nr:putative Lysyl endopeptidase [Variovorax sp.]